MHGPDAAFSRLAFSSRLCAAPCRIGHHFQSHDSSISACLVACLLAGLVDSSNVLFQVPSSLSFVSLLLVLLARAESTTSLPSLDILLTSLCSNFPVQAGQPSPYPPSMNASLGGQRPGSQNAPSANPAGQNGTPTFNNYRFTPTQPNGPNSPGFGSPDFGGAFSQQFPPPQ